jgi:cellulose synthase/poly-beta-1,6-N-acetylglucosamine synthase-like glycosyltransferase
MVSMAELYSMAQQFEPTPIGGPVPYPAYEDGTIQPYVSVIVPMRNEEGFAARCLQALAAQDYPRERYEVIVVDGNSTDGTAKEVREMVLAYGVPDVSTTNPTETSATGLNLGRTICGGEVIIRVDGHTRVDPNFISESVKKLIETGADAVGGPIRTRGHGTVGRAIALAMASPFGVGDASFRHTESSADGAKDRWVESVPFAAYPRDVFERVGYFAEDLNAGEDDEFNYRLRESGGRILMSPAIRSVYFSRPSLQGLLQQYWNYGIAKAEVLRRHPSRISPRHAVPSALVLSLTAGPVLGLFSRKFAWLAAIAAGSYALANGFASWRIGRDGNKAEMPYLPLAFGAMHFGAGAGMLAGLWRIISGKAKKQGD